ARIFRTDDRNLEALIPKFAASREFGRDILAVPVISDASVLSDYDAIFMGSPTYFGNVSASMKTFMDAFGSMWDNAVLHGKLFCAFASAATTAGGGDMCLNSLNVFAQHMGMITVPVPSNALGHPQPAAGFLHCSGADSLMRPENDVDSAIDDYIARFCKISCGL
ncbi:MAG: NAD(P)H-dependent oxidoreductase, partial [Clostridia bacterium]